MSAPHTQPSPDEASGAEIRREAKGLVMRFSQDRVTKDFSNHPTHPSISREEQTRRMEAEIAAYERFHQLQCPFVPRLLEIDRPARRFSIQRIPGRNILDISQDKRRSLPVFHVVRHIHRMSRWLMRNRFSALENNAKDIILDNANRLHLIDFETYRTDAPFAPWADLNASVIHDIFDRIIVRKARRARLTPAFLRLALLLSLRHPVAAFKAIVANLQCRYRDTWIGKQTRRIASRLGRMLPK